MKKNAIRKDYENKTKFLDYMNDSEIINRYKILSVKPLTGGLINDVYRIDTSNGSFVVKILNQNVTKNIERYVVSEKLANICKQHEVTVVSALEIDGTQIINLLGENIMVYPYIDGYAISESNIEPKHVRKIAELLSKIHSIDYKIGYSKIIRHSIDWSKFIQCKKFDCMPFKKIYLNNYQKYYGIFENVIQAKNKRIASPGICHRDIKPSNVLWKYEAPYLIDFESCRVDDTGVDFLETLLRWTGMLTCNLDYDLVKLFLDEYTKCVSIENIDFENLVVANLLGRFDFLYYNLDLILNTDEIEQVDNSKECEQVLKMMHEIEYYIDNMQFLINYLKDYGNKK